MTNLAHRLSHRIACGLAVRRRVPWRVERYLSVKIQVSFYKPFRMIPTASLNLDDQLCFALYAATSRIIRAYRGPLAEIGLTYPQYLAMLVLWERGEQTVKGLSDRLALDSSTLTPLLKRLESAGFVMRKRDASDERVVRVSATPAGHALRRPAAQIQKKVACKTQLPNDSFVSLRSQLHELAKTMAAEQEAEASA